ncbi:MAG: serine hydrolase [Methylococcales bacterium]|nr:serine hydrolase [Methylococcales bacterium]
MKILKTLFKWFSILVFSIVIALYATGYSYLIKAVRTIYLTGHTTAYLEDYSKFDNRGIPKSTQPQPWPLHKNYNTVEATDTLKATHKQLRTIAYLIIKNDSIWHESYFDGFDKNSKTNSFSMAKSITSALMGKAIQEGKIKSLNQPVGDYFPEFKKGLAKQMTVGDLSSMGSGLNWDESYYSPFSVTTRAYFDSGLRDILLQQKVTETPGQSHKYLSGNTELLAMVIEKATGTSLSNYLYEKFWEPMGAENDALWQLDEEDGIEKAYCCIASNARDFARFGKLYKNKGNFNGKQILDTAFVEKSIVPRFADYADYGYGMWLHTYMGKQLFYMRGHLGQFTIVIP